MGQALYRKYRSKSLEEVVGQEHITGALAEALKIGRISHAYLFTGPRGTGKTSIARILAHAVNDLPYTGEDNHVDIIEIDAASNRGIDEIRDLREKVYMAPVSAKYKVYIIDEVHMLTTQAFNALLKTLEEPPAHVIFVLATTEVHKLPETIISRTQRHIFKPGDKTKVAAHLKRLAKQEKIDIDDTAIDLLAEHGGGSFRDSVSLLDQAGNSGRKVTLEVAQSLLGIPPEQAISELLDTLRVNDTARVLAALDGLETAGYHPTAIAQQLGARLRDSLISGDFILLPAAQLDLMAKLLNVAPAHEPRRILEIALLQSLEPNIVQVPAAAAQQQPAPVITEKPVAVPATKESVEKADIKPKKPMSRLKLEPTIWPDILGALKKQYNTLYGVMRMAVPEFSEGKLLLRFKFAFHQKRMNEAKHRKIVSDIITELTGETIVIECVHDKDAELSEAPSIKNGAGVVPPRHQPDESLAAISNIFGGGELLES
jgi:DNA polymerase-3 subunit gamma/tau